MGIHILADILKKIDALNNVISILGRFAGGYRLELTKISHNSQKNERISYNYKHK